MGRFTALAIGMIIGGALLLGCSFIIVKGDITLFNSKNSHYIDKTYECEDEVKDLTVRETSGSVVIRKGDVQKATVSYSDREDESLYDISESDGELTVTRRKESGFHFFEIDFSDHKMVITLPEDFKGHVKVNNSSGSIKMNDLTAEDLSIENTSGSIKLEDVTSDGALSAKNTSGSIKMNDVEAGGDVKAENTSGSIKFDRLKSGEDMSLKTTSGSIKGSITGKESDYRIHASVTSGSCNLKDTDTGDKELNAQVSSGSIKIEFVD